VTAKHGTLTQYYPVRDIAIMSYVGTCHQVAVATQTRIPIFFFGSPIDCDIFSNDIPISNDDLGGRTSVTDVLRFSPNDSARRNPVVFADFDVTQYGDSIDQYRASANFRVGSNDTERSDLHVLTNFSTGIDVCQVGDFRWLRFRLAILFVFNW
jgi:hypothetical protein